MVHNRYQRRSGENAVVDVDDGLLAIACCRHPSRQNVTTNFVKGVLTFV